ncbi:MAG: glycosyltransferase family 117 protein [Limisphaerales bacterium]
MSNDKIKAPKAKSPPPSKPAPPPAPRPPPMYRRIDWLTFAVTTALVFIGYYLTLAPDLTLEDSGELAVGSFYAGVPHPPGYPVWTIWSWLFTVLAPFNNIAWRVGLSSAVAGALSCGLLALMVSRGSSMIIEGIADRLMTEHEISAWKNLDRRWENAICMISGYVAGMLVGFNGFMWSQALIVEVYPFSVLSLMALLCCLLRWVYAPNQTRYLYWAAFLFGICITNHQTLIVAAMGLEVAIMAAHPKVGRDLFLLNSIVYLFGLYLKASGSIGFFDGNLPLFMIYNIVGVGSMIACGWLSLSTRGLGTEWKIVLIIAVLWFCGAAFYFYMPLTSMTNPPMNWGYPRTVEGFFHALTRGQYERTNPTDSLFKFISQIRIYFVGAIEEFNVMYLLIGLVPFGFYRWMQKRERAWMVGTTAIYLCLAFLLLILLNPSADRQSREQTRVFFTASHLFLAMWIGFGLTLIATLMITQYQRFRIWGLYGSAVASAIALYGLADLLDQGPAPTVLKWSVVLLVLAAIGAVVAARKPEVRNKCLAASAVIAVVALGLFGKGFLQLLRVLYQNRDPLIINTALYALGLAGVGVLLFGLFRNRAPMAGLLGLFALMPAHSILSHWSDNEQRGHLFGYWFGHDMFTPPFTEANRKPIYPEMARDAILFGGTDPGRFCPTYMIFCESFIPPERKPRDPKFDRRDVYIITQNALADVPYLEYIRAQYFPSAEHDPYFFTELLRTKKDLEYGTTNFLARLWLPVDRYFTELGARVEKRRRAEGVYPAKEIYTPSPEDHNQAFTNYMGDAQRRLAVNQLEPGEDVKIMEGRVQVSGQVSVMMINALLAKVIFDRNPTNEFYVEESFPLKWMYPYLSPYGIIMKVNRNPLPEITDEMVRKDHEFWSLYSDRLTGNWINYDTPVKDICDFAERVYLRRDYRGFKGDRKFIRDDDAQKAFSKLRSSIAGVYVWRINAARNPVEQQRMLKEADFAFRQAFCFCPFSPEAVFRYSNLLASANRIDDALRLAQTCLKFDPENSAVLGLIRQLDAMRQGAAANFQAQHQLTDLEQQYRTNPANLQTAFNLVGAYVQVRLTNQAIEVLNRLVANPKADGTTLLTAAQAFAQLGLLPQLESTLQRLVRLLPDNPEAWYDLAVVQTTLGKTSPAMQSLTRCVQISNQRLAKQPGAKDLRAFALEDARLAPLHPLPEFQKLVATK